MTYALRSLTLAFLLLARIAFADVWVADDKSLYKLDLAANQTVLTVPSSGTLALAVDAKDGSVWTLTDKTLAKRSSAGAVVFQLDLKTAGLSSALNFALDARDGSLWIGEGEGLPNGKTRLFAHIAGNGSIIGAYPSPGGISGIAVALDQSVWVLGNKRLLHYTPQGAVQSDTDLKPLINGDPKLFLVDSIGAWVWVSAQKRLIRIDAHAQSAAPLLISVAEDATALASDEQRGVIWVLAGKRLYAYDSAGALKTSIDTEAIGIKSANSLAFDPVTRSLWVGNDKGVTRLTQDGANPILIPTAKQVNFIGVSPFALDTRLRLVAPPDGSLGNNATLPLALQLQALCSGSDCGFGSGFYHGYTLSVQVNGQEVGSSFVIDPDTGKATYTPTTRYAEGLNGVTAQATDSFGQVSNTVNFSFTIDTIAPKFTGISPVDGSFFGQPLIKIAGSVDDTTAMVTLDNLANWNGTGKNPATQNFSYQVTLKPGINTFKLSAADAAGNIAQTQIALGYIPVTIGIADPADGATLYSNSASFSGAFTGPPGTQVQVNGVTASLAGGTYTATVPLVSGSNTITATATSPDGVVMGTSIQVTLVDNGNKPPVITFYSPNNGDVFQAPVTVLIYADAYDPDGFVRDFTAILSNGSGNGLSIGNSEGFAYYNATDLPAGTYIVTASATDDKGAVSTRKITFTVTPDPADQPFVDAWNGMSDALKTGDKVKALTYLSSHAKDKYARVFDDLSSQMEAIFTSSSQLVRISMDGAVGEYAAIRVIDGKQRIFLVYFLKDKDGVWKIDEM